MSNCDKLPSLRQIDELLIDKILEKGQRLRNSMIKTIISNDPLHTEIDQIAPKSTLHLDDLPSESTAKIRAFLQGDFMPREDEKSIFETLRSLSSADLCKAADQTYRSNGSCRCPTCFEYSTKDFHCDLKRQKGEITRDLQKKNKNRLNSFLPFVDSLKISISNVVLNEGGVKKICEVLGNNKVACISQTFFLEYEIPEKIRNYIKVKAKTDSGLDSGNLVRLCTRKSNDEVVSFKQTMVHEVANLDKVNLDEVVLKFRITFRNLGQKSHILLGETFFVFSSFEDSKNLHCNQELSIKIAETRPIVVGALRISLQLGCEKLYFGKEFIDGIMQNKENSIVLDTDEMSEFSESITSKHISNRNNFDNDCEAFRLDLDTKSSRKSFKKPDTSRTKLTLKSKNFEPKSQQISTIRPNLNNIVPESTRSVINKSGGKKTECDIKSARSEKSVLFETEKTQIHVEKPPEIILFGYLGVKEAKFTRKMQSSHFCAQFFAQDFSCTSEIVAPSAHPAYNFSQNVPIIYDDELLLKLRENHMIIEFFEQSYDHDFPIGIAKLPLQQFYLAYRNKTITRHLLNQANNKKPIVSSNGWQIITNPVTGNPIGHCHAILALGTFEQIENLLQTTKVDAPKISTRTIDIGTQSEQMEPNKDPQSNIESLLHRLVAQRPQNSCVENATNTESIAQSARSTDDLLESLEKALTTPKKASFRAEIAINSALHLPSRKKCKSRKNKAKPDDILPSTYVTFDEMATNDVKITQIVAKCTDPKWDFKCQVSLPVEVLEHSTKPLVFKVWRKATNTTLVPNLNTDFVIGLASVDLTVLAAGLPSVQGWFNVQDLSKKTNGQINIHVTPLEDISKLCKPPKPGPGTSVQPSDEPSELLGRALKRKFTELDEITQRLRLRLSKVTNDESESSTDETAEEFERDINTLSIEDDYDLVNFEQEAEIVGAKRCNKDIGLLQTNGANGLENNKAKIDLLLEKLSLLAGEKGENQSRYVSGCSHVDSEAIFDDLEASSRPNLFSGAAFSRNMGEKFEEWGRKGPEAEELEKENKTKID